MGYFSRKHHPHLRFYDSTRFNDEVIKGQDFRVGQYVGRCIFNRNGVACMLVSYIARWVKE